jgi:hypothetical protein
LKKPLAERKKILIAKSLAELGYVQQDGALAASCAMGQQNRPRCSLAFGK